MSLIQITALWLYPSMADDSSISIEPQTAQGVNTFRTRVGYDAHMTTPTTPATTPATIMTDVLDENERRNWRERALDMEERQAVALERLVELAEQTLGPAEPLAAVDQWLGSLDLEQLEADAYAGAGLSANPTGLIIDQLRAYLTEQ